MLDSPVAVGLVSDMLFNHTVFWGGFFMVNGLKPTPRKEVKFLPNSYSLYILSPVKPHKCTVSNFEIHDPLTKSVLKVSNLL